MPHPPETSPSVLVTHEDPFITIITLNRPQKRNALNVALIEQLHAAILAVADDKRRRVLILRGNGPVFCAGLDLVEATLPDIAQRSATALAAMYKALCALPLITIASAQGAAMGGGAGLVAACDLAIAADDLHITYPEVHRGLVAALVTCMLRHQVTQRTAQELLLLGQPTPAARARELGLINRVVHGSQLESATLELAHTASKGAPGAVMRTKRLLQSLNPTTLEADLDRALEFHLAARHSPEAAEGIAAFVEKRPPKWGTR